MAQFRPAGLSDEDSDSDDYGGFLDKPIRKYTPPKLNEKKKIEINLQDAIINGNVQEVEEIVAAGDAKPLHALVDLYCQLDPLTQHNFVIYRDILDLFSTNDKTMFTNNFGILNSYLTKSDLYSFSIEPQNDSTLKQQGCNFNLAMVCGDELNYQVNMKLDSGWTPLMHACFHAQDKIVKFLLDKGADPNLHADSVTPVMTACSNSSASNEVIYSIVMDLIEKDCILNVGDKYGQTPLMRAISSGRVSVVEKLISLQVNIEMRDQQGWTAVFWAAHHNQPDILEILIENGARLNEVDRSNRTVLEIAESHEYENIVEILKKHMKLEEDEQSDSTYYLEVTPWQDYYPGITQNGRPNYSNEIPYLLYGMNCDRLTAQIMKNGLDLRSFLLLQEEDMIKMGIEMPYERQRLIMGLRNFHKRGWKINAVAGFFAAKSENYNVLECLTSLGTHLQQIYIMEATLQYILREYNNIQHQIKFEPPDSPTLTNMKKEAKKLLKNINSIRFEMKNLKNVLLKIQRSNPPPADLIKERTVHDIAKGYITEAFLVLSIGLLVYQAKTFFTSLLKK